MLLSCHVHVKLMMNFTSSSLGLPSFWCWAMISVPWAKICKRLSDRWNWSNFQLWSEEAISLIGETSGKKGIHYNEIMWHMIGSHAKNKEPHVFLLSCRWEICYPVIPYWTVTFLVLIYWELPVRGPQIDSSVLADSSVVALALCSLLFLRESSGQM
jgi:hypothetical protein